MTENLKSHKKIHSNDKLSCYKYCEYLHTMYVRNPSQIVTINIYNTLYVYIFVQTLFNCENCEATFTTTCSVKTQMRTMHKGFYILFM